MPRKGVCGVREGGERRFYWSDRIEEAEKELAESEAISAEVPRLRETYFQAISGLP